MIGRGLVLLLCFTRYWFLYTICCSLCQIGFVVTLLENVVCFKTCVTLPRPFCLSIWFVRLSFVYSISFFPCLLSSLRLLMADGLAWQIGKIEISFYLVGQGLAGSRWYIPINDGSSWDPNLFKFIFYYKHFTTLYLDPRSRKALLIIFFRCRGVLA